MVDICPAALRQGTHPVIFTNTEVNITYLLTKWEGRMGKYLARGPGVDLAQTSSQIFSQSEFE